MDKSSISGVHIIRLTVWLFHQCSLMKQHKPPPLCTIEASVLSVLIRAPKPSTCRCWLSIVYSRHIPEKHSKFASRYSVRNMALACSSPILLRSNRLFPRITLGRSAKALTDTPSSPSLSLSVPFHYFDGTLAFKWQFDGWGEADHDRSDNNSSCAYRRYCPPLLSFWLSNPIPNMVPNTVNMIIYVIMCHMTMMHSNSLHWRWCF